jgi:hypothetical protein
VETRRHGYIARRERHGLALRYRRALVSHLVSENCNEYKGGAATAQPFQAPKTATIPLIAFILLVFLKAGALLAFGPTLQPDSFGYISYADSIVDGTFRHIDLSDNAIPPALMRVIGLPAIIAAAKVIAGREWPWAVVALQFAFSFRATILVYRLAGAFRLGLWLSLGAAAAYATSIQFVLDQTILSDSICGSAATIATCMLGAVALRQLRPSFLNYLGIGLMIAIAFLMRDVIAYLSVGLLPLVATAAMAAQSNLRRGIACILVFLPLTAIHFGYTEWNRGRIGAPVVTSISGPALLGAIAEASRYDPSVFSGSTPIDSVGRQILPTIHQGSGYEFELAELLHREYGWDAVQISHEARIAYLRTWWQHPRAMMRRSLFNISEAQLHQAFRPTETVRDLLLWNTGSDREFARWKVVVSGNWWMIPAVIAHYMFETISVMIFSAFLLVPPVRIVREGLSTEAIVSASLLFLYLAIAGMYLAVAFGPRYLAPVVAASIIGGIASIVWLTKQYRQRRITVQLSVRGTS